VTLASIADAVITTDKLGNIEYMNPVAEELAGCSRTEAEGLPSTQVFKIIDSYTREPVADPVEMVLSKQSEIGLTLDTVLLSRDGAEYAVDESAARYATATATSSAWCWSSITSAIRASSRYSCRTKPRTIH
jgi:PAS domain S-box-containing protein